MSNVHPINSNYNAVEKFTIWDAIAALDGEHCHVLFAQWGIGRMPESDDEVALEIGLEVEEVWEMQERALRELGFYWLMSQALGTCLPRCHRQGRERQRSRDPSEGGLG